MLEATAGCHNPAKNHSDCNKQPLLMPLESTGELDRPTLEVVLDDGKITDVPSSVDVSVPHRQTFSVVTLSDEMWLCD